MTAVDKFGIAFSIGFTVALIAIAMSYAGMQSAPADTHTIAKVVAPETTTQPTKAPAEETPQEPETPAAPAEETPQEPETPAAPAEETPQEPETPAETESYPSTAEVSIVKGASTPGCEANSECFVPSTVSVSVGGTVTWTNDDAAAHTVTSGTATDGPDGEFDSSIFMSGKTFEHTFDKAGSYDYFCVVHPWMTGNVTVE